MRSLPGKNARRGFSLIEMVLVVGGVTVILGLVGGLLHLLLRLDRYGRDYFQDTTVISRLSDQFRSDVRRAISATVDNNEPPSMAKLILSAPEKPTITYSWEGKNLQRTEAIAGKPNHYETYHVGRLSPIVFESKDGFVAMVAGRTPESLEKTFRAKIRIEARLGKTQKLGRIAESKK